jgi:glycerol-3-phosphate dehydrogenase (NAD(P)+)
LGDLATTCLSPQSRNHWLGCEIGKGKKLEQILRQTEMVVEGVETARSVHSLAAKHRVPMPISKAVYKILFQRENPPYLIEALWKSGAKREID